MITPFDTQRLDDECKRIALELSNPCMKWGTWSADLVRHVIMGTASGLPKDFCKAVYCRCRRPKVVES